MLCNNGKGSHAIMQMCTRHPLCTRHPFEVDPLVCTKCGGEMRIVSVILEHWVISRILRFLARKGIEPGRGPRCTSSRQRKSPDLALGSR